MMSQTLMYAKMDTKHGSDKGKHDALYNNGKHINKREKEMEVGRHTSSVTNLPSYKRVRMT